MMNQLINQSSGGLMLKKWLALIIFPLFLYPVFLKAIIIESPEFVEIEKYITNISSDGVLIVCDIDNTLLRATQHLGSVAWGDHTIAELTNKGISKEEAEEIEASYGKLYNRYFLSIQIYS